MWPYTVVDSSKTNQSLFKNLLKNKVSISECQNNTKNNGKPL